MSLHRTPLRARALRTGAAAVLVLTLAGGYAAPAIAAGPAAGSNASGNAQQQKSEAATKATKNQKPKKAQQSEKNQSSNSTKPKKNPTAAEASSTKGKPANPGQGQGKETAPGQVKTGGSATGKGQTKDNGPSGDVGSENGTGADGSPPGNNGTVKIAPLGEIDGIPDNTPHPGCTFQVEWYGFDEGPDVISTVSFAMQAPTQDVGLSVDGPSEVFVGGSPGRGAGNDGLDGVASYTLSFDGEPHAKQGYHVKLTVSTPHSNGNDTKSKVFWVAPCASEPGDGGEGTDGEGTDGEGTDGEGTDGEGTDADGTAADGFGSLGDAATRTETLGVTNGPAAQRAGAVPSNIEAGLRGGSARSWLPLGAIALGAALLVGALSIRERSRGNLTA